MRPIKKGDQVFVGYGYPLEEFTPVRRAELWEKYDFNCKCDKCEPHCSKCDRMLMASNPNFQFLNATQLQKKTGNSANLKDKCIAFLNEYGHLPWSKEIDIVLNIFTDILFEELKMDY